MKSAFSPSYAGLVLRFFAFCVDTLILFAAFLLIQLIFPVPANHHFSGLPIPTLSPGIWGFNVFAIASVWLYYAIFESSKWQATLGKKLIKIKVTGMHGQRISFARATGRYFAKFLSSLIFFIGYLMIAFTKKKQALHDIIAETLVIRE